MDEHNQQTTMGSSPDVTAIGSDILLPVLHKVYNDPHITAVEWKCDQLNGGIGGGAIYRFSGQGQILGTSRSWSVILKVLKKEGGSANPSDWNYYRREADVYDSSWLNELPDGIVAPRHFGAVDYADGTCWLWLEDIHDPKNQWTIADYGQVALNIGKFNGAYLTNRPLPQQAWLSSNWVRRYVNSSSEGMEILRNSLDHPLVKRWFPANTSEEFFRLWEQREAYFNVMDQLPQTICHYDFFRRNLFLFENSDIQDRAVAIVWAFIGSGCVGADISPLVIASLAFFEVPLDKVQDLDQIVFNGYLEGLNQTGWHGDPRQIRLGYLIANLRYTFSEIGGWIGGVFDENIRRMIEQAFGHPLGDIFDYHAILRNAVSDLDDERDKLMGELNYW